MRGTSKSMRAVLALGDNQALVVSRAQMYAAGLTRGVVRAQVRASRWRALGSRSVCLHNGPLSIASRQWAAVFEAGPRAMLDGETALVAGGLTGYTTDSIRVSVPRGARVRWRGTGVDIRQTRRWSADDRALSGVPRTRPEVAAVRAALWARSDKQAALLLTMTAQQGLATPEQMGAEALRVRRHRRRKLVDRVLLDLIGGVRAISELEFARECRIRGLPEPTRQAVRKGPRGTYYLDVVWEDWRVVVEIDGIHHAWATNLVSDALRHNDLALSDAKVLRLPLLGLRVAADDFFAQVETALRAAGWNQPLSPAV